MRLSIDLLQLVATLCGSRDSWQLVSSPIGSMLVQMIHLWKMLYLTLLVAGGLFLSTPRVFLKYLPNGLS